MRPLSLLLVLHWLDRPHKRNDRVEIGGCDLGVHAIGHWSRQFGAVRSNALGDCILDLIISPLAESLVGIGCDIATDARPDPGESWEFTPTGKGELHIQRLIVPRRCVAHDAMPECHQIGTIRNFILLGWGVDVGDGWPILSQWNLVLGFLN